MNDPRINPKAGDVVDEFRVLSANRQFVTYCDGSWTIRVPIRGWRNMVSPRFALTPEGERLRKAGK